MTAPYTPSTQTAAYLNWQPAYITAIGAGSTLNSKGFSLDVVQMSGFTVSNTSSNFTVTASSLTLVNVTRVAGAPRGGLYVRAVIAGTAGHKQIKDHEGLQKRLLPTVGVGITTPTIVNGQPQVVQWFDSSNYTPNITTANLSAVTASGYSPSGGLGDHHWEVATLTTPTGYGYSLNSWADSVALGPSWTSAALCQPQVAPYEHHNLDGTVYEAPTAVHFSHHYCEHMWLDMGDGNYALPFTWVIVAAIYTHQSRNHNHYILDSGRATTRYDQLDLNKPRQFNNDINLPGSNEGLTYRTVLAAERNWTAGGVGSENRWLRSERPNKVMPRMYFGIYTNTVRGSYIGSYGHHSRRVKRGTMVNSAVSSGTRSVTDTDVDAHQYYLMGRRNGFLGPSFATKMSVFELRFWASALTLTQIESQYKHLSTKYNFRNFQ